ncbi:hypothetical protein PPERSA_04252 [Pseudocohnilembus persalinus]|uniref:EF-hand domain-containing protein n=1 Tax=Pseudocohnilembus persalinus TaxID=266149 RepID=A0A0V0QP24_PSEPJ|nr:hypothetical protein PPERSA_04252 [Pseudocohnilembus persalinus]|eukprot:KRX03744.1 hypothetical protein PPERSA_04252 [Pseudocohnilembus persalinus]
MGSSPSQDIQKNQKGGLDKLIKDQKKTEKQSKEFPPYTANEIERLRIKFGQIDKLNQGYIYIDQLTELQEIKMHFFKDRILYLTEQKLKDEDKNEIDFETFTQILIPFHPESGKDMKYIYLFKIYDINQDGVITLKDIIDCQKLFYSQQHRQQLGYKYLYGSLMENEHFLEKLANDIMNEFDFDNSGTIDLQEFKVLVDDLDLLFRMNINF